MNPAPDPRQLEQMKLGDPSLQVEEASPISSRPPAMTASTAAGLFEDELLAGELGGGGGAGGSGGGGGGGSGNRWPRQETIALLKIRSEMDTAFKDANPKGPLWEEVSRKLGDLGYKRNAKKCKEKFENVHKYYKRTKEGRAGRQDGKSYKFFSELEALTAATSSSSASPASMQITSIPQPPPPAAPSPRPVPSSTLPVSSGVGFSNPTPVSSSIRFQQPVMFSVTHHPPPPPSASAPPSDFNPMAAGPTPNIGISFSSDTASFASDSSDDEMGIDEHDLPGGGEVGRAGNQDRKRKRASSSPRNDSGNETMMEFFERLMKQVLQKQEAMQQRFLEAIENREQDRMMREEAWKRQEIARYSREHELMAQERAIAASRDSAIITFLQKISGQTVQIPPAIAVPVVVPPAPPTPTPQPPAVSMPPPSSTPIQLHQSSQLHHQQQQPQQQACLDPVSKPAKYQQQQQQQIHQKHHQTVPLSVDHHQHQSLMVIPEQQIPPPQHQEIGTTSIGGSDASSSRWPKAEILALIQLRSGLEYRYLESGPKGPLWEDISAGMQRMGYKRNAKRCKEKWENINKYYKKVKESNKKRPEDAKTCPYYHQLDELYRNKVLGGGGGGFPIASQSKPDEQVAAISDPVLAITLPQEKSTGGNSEAKTSYGGLTATLFGEGSFLGAASGDKKPEDSVKIQQQYQQEQQLIMGDYDKIDDESEEDLDQEDDEDDDEGHNLNGDEMKMGYKLDFQGQNTSASSNGGGNGGPSFLTMVQ